MNYEKYENKIKELLANENIKYNEEELEKVVKYIVEKYDGKTILDENTIDFVLEIATEVATLRLDDKSIYAALLLPLVDFDNYN